MCRVLKVEGVIMKVLLISPYTEHVTMPVLPFGLVCIATAAGNAGHNIELLNLVNTEDPQTVIEKKIKEVAKKEKYTLVFNDRILLYGDEALDLSDKILNSLNAKYSKVKKR